MSWIISLVVLVVAICAGLAMMGFRGRITTVGVDLGTTFSVVGINKNGKVIIVEDKEGHRIFPSVVSYREDGEILAAYEALAQLSTDPLNTIFNAKRFIGRSFDEKSDNGDGDDDQDEDEDEAAERIDSTNEERDSGRTKRRARRSVDDEVKQYADEHPFKVVPCEKHVCSNYSGVGFEIHSNHPTQQRVVVAPEAVGSEVLKFLMRVTADFLGHNMVSKAVIAVPAKFTGKQREATGAAYKAAGLKVVRVIEEPTAAAVAYKLHKKSNIRHILVYDFGGGTLDVSLLYVAQGSVQVYATDGDDTLGGSDLDQCVLSNLKGKVLLRSKDLRHADNYHHAGLHNSRAELFEALNEHYYSESTQLQEKQVLFNATGHVVTDNQLCLAPSLYKMAENAKKELSSKNSATVSCYIVAAAEATQNVHKELQLVKVTVEISKEEFEQTCSALFERALIPITNLLHGLDMTPSDIDEVVLVGGTTRVPKVKEQLRAYFGGRALNDHLDPDTTVAYGAASILD